MGLANGVARLRASFEDSDPTAGHCPSDGLTSGFRTARALSRALQREGTRPWLQARSPPIPAARPPAPQPPCCSLVLQLQVRGFGSLGTYRGDCCQFDGLGPQGENLHAGPMFVRMCIKLQMQTQTGHKQIQTWIEPGYVQILTGICADLNRDTCSCEQYMSRYGQIYVYEYVH